MGSWRFISFKFSTIRSRKQNYEVYASILKVKIIKKYR